MFLHVIKDSNTVTKADQSLLLNESKLTDAYIIDSLIKIIGGHELRTPLSIIQGVTEILYDQENVPQEKEYLFDAIRHSVTRIEKLSGRLGIWQGLRTGYSFTQSSIVIDKEYINEIFENILDNENRKFVKMEFLEKQFEIQGSKLLFNAILSELIDNAFKFSEKEMEISIRVFKCNKYLNFSISNISSKTSFSEFMKYKAFTQFNRKKFEQQGLGIGIDIASMGIKSMGGRLMIQNKRNKLSNNQISFIAQFV